MRFLLLSLIFAASILHAAASSMTVSMESKGVPKAEFRSGTNAVLLAAKAADVVSTNSVKRRLYSVLDNFFVTGPNYSQVPFSGSSATSITSSTLSSSVIDMSVISMTVGRAEVRVYPETSGVSLTLSKNFLICNSTQTSFTITASGLTKATTVKFFLCVTFYPYMNGTLLPEDKPFVNVGIPLLFYMSAQLPASAPSI